MMQGKVAIARVTLVLGVVAGAGFWTSQWTARKHALDRVCELGKRAPQWRLARPVCRFPARNPGVLSDGRWWFAPVARPRALPVRLAWRERVALWTEGTLDRSPGLQALSRAVWLGLGRELPGGLSGLYQRGGLVHLLALSGQHVLGLMLLSQLLWGLLAWPANRTAVGRLLYGWGRAFLPVGCALALYWLNPGNESTARATTLVVVTATLAARGLRVPAWRRVAVGVVAMVVVSPDRIDSNAFLLSAFATLWLAVLALGEGPQLEWRRYVLASVAMPLLLMPLTAFAFAKVAWMAPLNGLVLGWIWSVVWIPLGFAAPVIAGVLGQGVLLPGEWAWQGFVGQQLEAAWWVGAGYRTVVRPTWLEFLALQYLVWKLVWWGHAALGRRGMK